MNLAVYGTLKREVEEKGMVGGYKLVFPGTYSFPAAIKDKDKSVRVEVQKIEDYELPDYDRYENVEGGLYTREVVNVAMDDGTVVEAWMYVAGDLINGYNGVYQEIPNGDWECRSQPKTKNQ